METWNAHRDILKDNFIRLKDEVKAQQSVKQMSLDRGQQRVEEAQPVAAGQNQGDNNDAGLDSHDEEKGGTQWGGEATSASSSASSMLPAAPLTSTKGRRLGLKPISVILAAIKTELSLPSPTSILEAIARSISLLGLPVAGGMTLNSKAVRVANMSWTSQSQAIEQPGPSDGCAANPGNSNSAILAWQ